MTFISYAQNAEDVLLWRTLKHIKNGFYIDVGANDPVDDSVTKAFYDRGWHGINIEPLKEHYECLKSQRLRDINLFMAAGNYNGELTLYDMPTVRGWATSDSDVANNYREQGLEVITIEVPVRRLDSICAQYAAKDIHFLKIDVEGCELDVLEGMNFQLWRPWVLVIEAKRPNSQESQHEAFEQLLFKSQYLYEYNDGVNRYYVAQEHSDLATLLSVQPNVLDHYQFIGYQRAEEEVKRALYNIDELNTQLKSMENRMQFSRKLALDERKLREIALVQNNELQVCIADLESRSQCYKDQFAEFPKRIQDLMVQLEFSQQQIVELEEKNQDLKSQLDANQLILIGENRLRHNNLNNIRELHDRQLAAMTSSLSWQITHPLREINYRLGKFRLKFYALRYGLLKRLRVVLAGNLKSYIKLNTFVNVSLQQDDPQENDNLYRSQLSPRAASVYMELKKALKERVK